MYLSKFKKAVILSTIVASLSGCHPVFAESNPLKVFVDANYERVSVLSKEYGVLPSVLMAKLALETGLGASEFNLEGYVKDLYMSNSLTNRLLTETASPDEAVALMFSGEVDKDYGFVSEMNNLLGSSEISSLDTLVFPEGIKPVFDYDTMRGAIPTSDEFDVQPILNIPLSSDSLDLVSIGKESIKNDVIMRNLAYNDELGLGLLGGGNTNKSWWQIWKSGYLESDFRVSDTVADVSELVIDMASAEVSALNLTEIISGSFYETSKEGVYAFGSDSTKALVNQEGRLLGLWSPSLKDFDVFGDYKQVLDVSDGFVTVGYRVGNLIDKPLLEVESMSDFEMTDDLERSMIAVKDLKPVKQFMFAPLYRTLYLVRTGKGHLVVNSDYSEVGTSADKSSDSTYTRVKTEVGDLWLKY